MNLIYFVICFSKADFQRRGDFGEPKENFTREWDDYKHGFGDLNGEFWFGNEFIHQLTKNKGDKGMRLRVELESHYGQSAWAEYDTFRLIDADRVPELLL